MSAETDLMTDWPDGGPPVVWRQELGTGMSGMSIVGNRLVTLYQDDSHQYAVCHESTTGARAWRTVVASNYRNQMGD